MLKPLTLFAAMLPCSALADLSWPEVQALYDRYGIRTDITTTPIDADWIATVSAQFNEAGIDASRGLDALSDRLAGTTLHVVHYTASDYSANYQEHDGRIILAFYFLPIFDQLGREPPHGFLELSSDVFDAMTSETGAFETQLGASMEEARAYSDGTSSEPYPGYIHRQGADYNYSLHAYIPDWIMVTITTLPDCGFRPDTRGWVRQHLCN